MSISERLASQHRLSSEELSALLVELGYINRLKNPCSKTLSKILRISMRRSQDMLSGTGVSGSHYNHLLLQFGIKQPEYPIH